MGVLRPGQMLEGTSYRVVREIGAGGMGVVYEIEHVRLKKRYVAKVIHDQIRDDEGAAKRMEREAQVLAGISHPNVVQVHDIGTTQDGVSYFVMEKLEGVDLRRTMKRVGVTRLRAVAIITDVLAALEYVHRRGIVHRDIKPENIFLAEQPHGTVTKVLDFGIVHIFDGDGRVSQGRITKTGGFIGTLYYAAPEQMQGKTAGPPNDVYAAGLVLFEMLAGRGPFDDDPGVGLSRCFKPAPLLTELLPTAPPELSRVVARALEQDPARRPSAGELAAALRDVRATLESAPGSDDDEAVRAEVEDLLRHMAPASAPRPAAGRAPTGDVPSVAVDATATPPTPVMEGALRRAPTDPRLALEATMASPVGEPPAPAAVSPAAVVAVESVRAPHPPTMPGAGVAPAGGDSAGARGASPTLGSPRAHRGAPRGAEQPPLAGAHAGTTPPQSDTQHVDAPSPLAGAHAGTTPPQSDTQHVEAPRLGAPPHVVAPLDGHVLPRTQTGPTPQLLSELGAGPVLAMPPHVSASRSSSEPGVAGPVLAVPSAASAPRSPSAPDVGPSHAGPAQRSGSTIPAQPARHESIAGAPARQRDNTSPGVYATVDHRAVATSIRAPVRPPWGAIAGLGAAVVVLALVGGAFAYRHKAPATESPSAATTAESTSTAPVTAPIPTVETAASTSAPTPPAASANEATATPVSATSEPHVAAGSRVTGAAATTAKHAQQPPAQPGRSATPASQLTTAAKASAPASPRASSNANKPSAPKDGYMPW